MELTPELLTSVDLREQWRGYNKDDVDDFLERVAAAIGDLQERLREAERRASDAHRRLADQADNDEIRNTLLLAQRTAAAAIEEATATAEQIVAAADKDAAERIIAAESRLARLEVEIDQREREQLGALAERRAALEADIEALATFAADHRARLKEALQVQLQAVEAAAFEPPQAPATSGITVGAGPTAADWVADPDVASARAELLAALSTVSGEQPDDDDEDPSPPGPVSSAAGAEADVVAPDIAEAPAPPDDAVDVAWAAAADDEAADVVAASPSPSPVLFDDEQLPEVVEVPSPSSDDEPVEWRHAVISDEPDDDPFLAELRRAVTDTEPLGPRDDTDEPRYEGEGDTHDPLGPPGRFRRRRTRR